MADPDKISETQSDTQATYDPAAEDAVRRTEATESSMVSESQDFHLVDSGETLKETQNEMETTLDREVENCVKICSDSAKGIVAQPEEPYEPKSAVMETTVEKNEDAKMAETSEKVDVKYVVIEKKNDPVEINDEEDVSNSKIETSEEKQLCKEEEDDNEGDDDDDDFVQSSQLETLSPLKKQITNLTVGGLSQKRKADGSDDTLTKFPRTCSSKDALSEVRKRLDDKMDEIFTSEKAKDGTMDDEVISRMLIIEETQETCENMENSESLEQVEEQLELALSQHPIEEDDPRSSVVEKTNEAFRRGEVRTIERVIEEKEDMIEKEISVPDESISEVGEEPKPTELSVDSSVLAMENNDETPKILIKSTTPDDTKEKSINQVAAEEASTMPKTGDVETNSLNKDSQKNETPLFVAPTSITGRSRMSIEVIYDRSTAPSEKKPPRELVEIDEDGEKIVLDSSQEGCDRSLEKLADINKIVDTSYKTCSSTDYKSMDSKDSSGNDYKSGYSLTNGSTDSRIADSDVTMTARSDLLMTDSMNDKKITQSPSKKLRQMASKIGENPEILSISDSEESFVVEERTRNKEETPTGVTHDNSTSKILPIEKELSIVVKLKCLVYVDETTKEQVEKVVTGVSCESTGADFSASRHRNSDNSASLADISSNDKDASPGSVTSIPNPYPLNPRFSMASLASSSSSSSAASLNAAKIAGIKFQLPRGPAKHAKKVVVLTDPGSAGKRPETDEMLEQLKTEWKNMDTVTCAIMNFASNELTNMDFHNGSALRVDNSLERIRSSTPEVAGAEKDEKIVQSATPKRGAPKRTNRTVKTTRAKNLRSSDTNGVEKASPVGASTLDVEKVTPIISRKRKSSPEPSSSTPSRYSSTARGTPLNDETNESDALVGKEVFAKWSDNKYYPGTVTGKTKTKFKVSFYDGQNKMIIEDFIVPMPKILNPGLSVYATSDEDDYGSCGIILEVKKLRDGVVYIVETDESEKLEVDIKNIFLTNDQVQVLKEETKIDMKSPPSTPKHLAKITLDNVIDGKRRSKRVLTPVATTPKGKRGRGSLVDKIVDLGKPSASGVSSSVKFEDNYGTTSDSTCSELDDADSIGVQEEIIGTFNEQDTKGPQSGIKGKARIRKKSETPEIVANLGPIPALNSDLFRGASFLLSCASLDTIERYQARGSSKDTGDSNSDPGTENEEEWSRKPFVRERLIAQLTAGGGKIYESFESIPSEEYENTKHITNVPNTTRKSLLCLSVGIKPYNHQWVIRSCQQNRIVNPSEEELPAGWSLLKKSYIEMFQRRNEKPFQTLPVIVVIPVTPANKEFVSFWRQICENAGGTVLLVESPDDGFIEGTVVLTSKHCPTWVIEKASSWNIPLVSTVWIIECLIEGNICSDDAHPSFKYNYAKRSSSHISHLKRR